MKYDRTNKDRPNVRSRIEHPVNRSEPVYSWDVIFWACKFKDGIYRPKHRYLAASAPKEEGEQELLEDVIKVVKLGRYHDWFFAPKEPL